MREVAVVVVDEEEKKEEMVVVVGYGSQRSVGLFFGFDLRHHIYFLRSRSKLIIRMICSRPRFVTRSSQSADRPFHGSPLNVWLSTSSRMT